MSIRCYACAAVCTAALPPVSIVHDFAKSWDNSCTLNKKIEEGVPFSFFFHHLHDEFSECDSWQVLQQTARFTR